MPVGVTGVPMNRAVPPIHEEPETLRALLKAERSARVAQRIHMLYLFASKQVQTRSDAARIIGVHRDTIGTWLDWYASGGLPALLKRYIPPGKKPVVTPAIEAELRAALSDQAAFDSYWAIVEWLWREHQIKLTYSAVYALVRKKLKAPLPTRRAAGRSKGALLLRNM